MSDMFAPPRLAALTLCVALSTTATALAQSDHRAAQSSVKHQGARGTCAAFAVCAALETLPGVPDDLSEQLLFANRKLHEKEVDETLRALGAPTIGKEGNGLTEYLGLFSVFGTCHESVLPYDPNPRRVVGDIPADLKAYLERGRVAPAQVRELMYAYGKYGFDAADITTLDAAALRDIDALKKLLDLGAAEGGALAIPVGYAIHVPSWSSLETAAMAAAAGEPKLVIHPGMHWVFGRPDGEVINYQRAKFQSMATGEPDFADAVLADKWLVGPIDDDKDNYGGHAVTIVGYTEHGFWIKNSWGTDWGAGGYALVNWDFHKLFAGQGLVIRKPRLRHANLDPFAQSRLLREGDARAKVQPLGDSWRISTFFVERRDPELTGATYRLEGQFDGRWEVLAEQHLQAGAGATGLPWTVPVAAVQKARTAQRVRLHATYADDLREAARTFEPFSSDLTHSIALRAIEPLK